MKIPKPVVLVILDGFGHREDHQYNAIAAAKTPHLDALYQKHPHGLISGSGLDVGLPVDQMGNSEVGHMNLGSGRVVFQDLTRIDQAIERGDFFENQVLVKATKLASEQDTCVHLMALLSDGGVHSHISHVIAMAQLAVRQGCKKIVVHAFLDGRDTPPQSAAAYIKKLDDSLSDMGVGRIATLVGRYYAMDRDKRWDRVAQAFELIVHGKAKFQATTAMQALTMAYDRHENDEFVQATCIGDSTPIRQGEAVIFMNFRADRARQLTQAFIEPDFQAFDRGDLPKLGAFVMLTQYAKHFDVPCAYQPQILDNVLGDWLSQHHKTQLRIAETEKYAHVTFFFSGGREAPFDGEERILVPSPQVATYDLMPEMSAALVTDHLVKAIKAQNFDFIVVNYANADMVGHTGIFDAAVKAVECLDHCLGRVIQAVESVQGAALITADHGNIEQMFDLETAQAHTAHTCQTVPLIYVGEGNFEVRMHGVLADVAPTILQLMGLPIPSSMTGQTLLVTKELNS